MAFPVSPTNGQITEINGINYQFVAADSAWVRIPSSANIVLGNLTANNITSIGNVTASRVYTTNGLFWSGNGVAFSSSGADDTLRANVGAFQLYANANVGALFLGNAGTQANLGAFQTYANTTFITLDANVGTLFLGNATTQANLGAFQTYANTSFVTLDANIGTLFLGNVSTQANLGAFYAYANTKIGNNSNGNLVIAATTTATSNVTGALVVRGGVGVSGNVFANTIYTTTGIRWAGNGAVFSSGGGGGGASALDDLTDVIITSPTTSQVLKYNGTNWVNAADATGGGGGSGITYTSDPTSPAFPTIGDQWYDTDTDILYEYIEDGTSSYWVDIQSPMFSTGITNGVVGNVSITGPTSSSGHLTVSRTATITGNIITLANINVSNSANVLGNLTVGGNVAFSRSATIAANLTVTGNISSGNVTTANIRATGNITTTGDVSAATISSANVTVSGNVTTANVSATDIRSTGNITSGNVTTDNLTVNSNISSGNVTVSGNVTSGNVTATGKVTFTGANVYLGNVANVSIGGGSSGQYLQTDGIGDLTWQTLPVTNIQEFTATPSQTTFTVIGTYTVGSVLVFVNGIQMNSADYTATNGTTVVLTEARNVGDTVRIIASFGAASLVSGLTLNVNNLQSFSIAMSAAMGM
jgi:hypothetical protein